MPSGQKKKVQTPLSPAEAKTEKVCRNCGSAIGVGDTYYSQRDAEGKMLGKPFCEECYKSRGNSLIKSGEGGKALNRILENSGIQESLITSLRLF